MTISKKERAYITKAVDDIKKELDRRKKLTDVDILKAPSGPNEWD